jgi:signal peptidase I
MRTVNDLGFIDSAPADLGSARCVRVAKGDRRRRIGNMVFAVAFSLAALGWIVTLRPARMGGPASFVMVQGVSMNPTYHTGDLVITHRRSSYAVGDVVAYTVPKVDVGAGLTVIHRIVGGSPAAGFVTQGDNNPTPDDWRPTLAEVEGKAWMVVPHGGKILAFLHAPIPLAGFAASAVVMWIVYQDELPTLGRRRRRSEARPTDEDVAEPENVPAETHTP